VASGIPTIFWVMFLLAMGASTGSFLNVVVYRLPRDMSLLRPGSHCTRCQKRIAWYDNIPVLAWFVLRGRCRYCGAAFSFRYPAVEFLTALLFVGLYWAYFKEQARSAGLMPGFEQGGWLIYTGHICLICVLLASSLIDGEHWIIPLSLCYTAAGVGVVLSMIWPYVVEGPVEHYWRLIPWAGPKTAALAVGAGIGLFLSLLMIKTGIIKRSFNDEPIPTPGEKEHKNCDNNNLEQNINIRIEMVREILFLTAPVVFGICAYFMLIRWSGFAEWWVQVLSGHKWLTGLLGSVYGFMIGGAVVWATRIMGSVAFGKEAMGLGDVHLMAAVGAVLGWASPTIAFFLAPFFGLGWAVARLIIHRSREIPYGPFLSMATLTVMLFQDRIVNYLMQSMP
jgi:leader peptidase (prepilin peptidase)/N-methyltransferase